MFSWPHVSAHHARASSQSDATMWVGSPHAPHPRPSIATCCLAVTGMTVDCMQGFDCTGLCTSQVSAAQAEEPGLACCRLSCPGGISRLALRYRLFADQQLLHPTVQSSIWCLTLPHHQLIHVVPGPQTLACRLTESRPVLQFRSLWMGQSPGRPPCPAPSSLSPVAPGPWSHPSSSAQLSKHK